MSGWTPVTDETRSLGDQQLDEWVARGAPVDHGWRGAIGLLFVIAIILAVIGAVWLFVDVGLPILFHIPPVSTPIAEWTNVP